MSKEAKEIYEFGGFRLDIREHVLERLEGGKVESIPEKAFQTLAHLVRNSGNLITKEELLLAVWPDTTVEENNLDKAIHTIRHVLGENPREQKYIETVRKHGYRFVAAVNTIETSQEGAVALPHHNAILNKQNAIKPIGEPTISATTTESGTFVVSAKWPPSDNEELAQANGHRHENTSDSDPRQVLESNPWFRNKWRLAIAVPFLLALTAGLLAFAIYRSTDRAVLAGTTSIAVFPLDPIDRANRNDLYEIGIADSVIHHLGSAKGIFVRPLSSTRKYSEIEQDPIKAGRELRVDYVVVSNYQIANGRIKVTAQLLEVSTGKAEDTLTVEKDATNLFSAQDAIADAIGKRFLSRFGVESAGFQPGHGTTNEEAYGLYLQAMNLSEERGVQNLRKALEYLDRAVALDPNYALAWASKAHLHRDIVGHTDANQTEHYEKSMEAIRGALALDPNLSDAYSAWCFNKSRYEYDFNGAETDCKRALELDPNSAVAHKTYANFLYTRGRFDESIVEIKKAMDLQPVSYRNQQIYGLALYFAGRYGEAEDQFKRLIELNPNHTYIHGRLIKILEAQGKESKALEYLIRVLTSQGEAGKPQRFSSAYRTGGWRNVVLEQIKAAEGGDDPRNFQLACWNARIGNKDKALEYLEKAYRERSFQMPILQVEPQLESLRNDPRFVDLVRRVEGE